MQTSKEVYDQFLRQRAAHFIAKGHKDIYCLRELLILTTNKISGPTIEEYFRSNHHDQELLQNLIDIALEGEDAGDAPWAAANTLVDFPAAMLEIHRADLIKISQFDWFYLSKPALAALAKIDAEST